MFEQFKGMSVEEVVEALESMEYVSDFYIEDDEEWAEEFGLISIYFENAEDEHYILFFEEGIYNDYALEYDD